MHDIFFEFIIFFHHQVMTHNVALTFLFLRGSHHPFFERGFQIVSFRHIFRSEAFFSALGVVCTGLLSPLSTRLVYSQQNSCQVPILNKKFEPCQFLALSSVKCQPKMTKKWLEHDRKRPKNHKKMPKMLANIDT